MPKYLVERNIPGAGKLSKSELRGIVQKSCGVLATLGTQIQWVESVYIAPDEKLVREHARQGGFPANELLEIATIIDPATSE